MDKTSLEVREGKESRRRGVRRASHKTCSCLSVVGGFFNSSSEDMELLATEGDDTEGCLFQRVTLISVGSD